MMLSQKEVEQIDLSRIEWIHFVGLLSPFSSFSASKLADTGKRVTASEYDLNSPARKPWEEKGILYEGGHERGNIKEGIQLVVYPNGPIPGNVECEEAEKRGLPALTNSQMVGLLSRGLKTIAIAGTHGKTTTTAMIIWMIHSIVGEPNYIVGDAEDKLKVLNRNWNSNESPYFVVEACEYKKQFLARAPKPYIAAVTHIDLDHTDFYGSQDEYNGAFVEFLSNASGSVIMDLRGTNEKEVAARIQAKNVTDVNDSRSVLPEIEHWMKGKHNLENFLRAYSVGVQMGFTHNDIISALNSFPGISKRFELVGETENGNPVINDYAHNPMKVAGAINATREAYPNQKLCLIFQPHSHERSFSFLDEFTRSISDADIFIMTDIFSPRRESEEERALITSEDFFTKISSSNPKVESFHAGTLEQTIEKVVEIDKEKQIVFLCASAGNLSTIFPNILKVEKSHR